jgi:hypothetical protein
MGPERKYKETIDESDAVLELLRGGSRLSLVLPRARALAETMGDSIRKHWLDCEIYGLQDVPLAPRPREDARHRAGVWLFMDTRSVEDVSSLTVDEVLSRSEPRVNRDRIMQFSVGEIERMIADHESTPVGQRAPTADSILQQSVLDRERRRVLDKVRAFSHEYVAAVRARALDELANFELLGPDYRLVVGSLEALDGPVSDELKSALQNLRGETPAQWSAAALLCRNVVLKLGPLLFESEAETHFSNMADRELSLRGPSEKNRLLAYLDVNWCRAPNDACRKGLERCSELVIGIYERGSAGKQAVRHSLAQQIVVDTFEMVSLLATLTDLSSHKTEVTSTPNEKA